MKRRLTTIVLLLLAMAAMAGKQPKYVFYFIGDGMGPSHVIGTELYLGEKAGVIGRPHKLRFTQFPVTSFVTTFSASNGVTDSAASGTALATGEKTNNGCIGVTPDGTPVYSVAHYAKEAGYAVGISTTVCINHATPGAFYAHQKSRSHYPQIAKEMLTAGYDFYAGGDPVCSDEERAALYAQAQSEGYAIARGYDDYRSKRQASRMMLYQKEVATEIPYTIDRSSNDLTLAQITEAGIDFLMGKKKKGFFMMVEGGKIDYASHDNDAATMMHEVLDFDAAIAVALDFYNKHKDETLIIVTADHETGGLVLGYNGSYTLNLKALAGQHTSEDELGNTLIAAAGKGPFTWDEAKRILTNEMGLWSSAKIDEKQSARLKELFDSAAAATDKEQRDSKLRSLANLAKHYVSYAAAISWASGNHSGTFVPLFAIGKGAELFGGVIDNTDIPKLIKKAARY